MILGVEGSFQGEGHLSPLDLLIFLPEYKIKNLFKKSRIKIMIR
jgi:hypothetical protein